MAEARRFMDEARQTLCKLDEHCGASLGSNVPQQGVEMKVSDTLFRSGRSIAALQTASEGLLVWDESGAGLHCSACIPDPRDTKKQHSGVFKYDPSLGSSFDPSIKMPKRFTSLRDSVAKHFRSDGHKAAKQALIEREKRNDARTAANNSAESHVLRTAYLVLKKSLSHLLFEDLIVLQHLNDAAMGNLNHSRMLMDRARAAFSEAILENIRDHVETRPCVSVMADKVTVARRTVDVTAVLSLVPDAEPDHVFQSFVVGAPVVKDHDGEALARDVRDSIAKVGVTSAEKVASIAADGQYHHNAVPEKLVRLLSKDEPPAVPALWDHAHLMNLAEADSRREKAGEWVRDTVEVMTAVNKRCLLGKGLEVLLTCGEDVGEQVLRPKLWSETRFAPHAGQAFSVFRRNLDLLCTALEKRRGEETRPAQLNELAKELAQLKGL